MAEGSWVGGDLPPVVERTAAEQQVHLNNNERANDQAEADHDTESVSFEIFC